MSFQFNLVSKTIFASTVLPCAMFAYATPPTSVPVPKMSSSQPAEATTVSSSQPAKAQTMSNSANAPFAKDAMPGTSKPVVK